MIAQINEFDSTSIMMDGNKSESNNDEKNDPQPPSQTASPPSSEKVAVPSSSTSSSSKKANPSNQQTYPTLSSLPLLVAQNLPSHKPKVRSPDEHIIGLIDLKNKKSIERFFKIQKGKGKLKPIPSYLGAQANWRDCFKNI